MTGMTGMARDYGVTGLWHEQRWGGLQKNDAGLIGMAG